MIIFPAIDLKDGKCVRLYKGDFSKATIFNKSVDFYLFTNKIYSEDMKRGIKSLLYSKKIIIFNIFFNTRNSSTYIASTH